MERFSSNFLRVLIDTIPDHIAIIDDHGEILGVNSAWAKFAVENGGGPAATGVSQNYLHVCRQSAESGDETARSALAEIQAVLGGTVASCAVEYPCHSCDRERWFLMRLQSVPSEGALRFLVSHTDITQRKQVEEQFRATFEQGIVGNVVIDAGGVIRMFNAASEAIFGFARDEVIGENVRILMPEPDQGRHDSYIQRYLDTREARIIGIGREVTGRRRDGTLFPMHLGIGEMMLGDQIAFIGSITDLTETKALEQQLFRAQRMEAVGQLTGGIAHDFNNLMAVALGNAEVLEDVFEEGSEHAGIVAEIIGTIDRGTALTQRLLAFSRQQVLTPKRADVTFLIADMEPILRRALGEERALHVCATAGLWPVMVDPSQFENAILNLTINARDAMPKGGKLVIETVNKTLVSTAE